MEGQNDKNFEFGVPGIYIPGEVLHNPELSFLDKLIYGYIRNLDSTNRGCWASNKHLHEILGNNCSARYLQESIKKLRDLHYIIVEIEINPERIGGRERKIFINSDAIKIYKPLTILYHKAFIQNSSKHKEIYLDKEKRDKYLSEKGVSNYSSIQSRKITPSNSTDSPDVSCGSCGPNIIGEPNRLSSLYKTSASPSFSKEEEVSSENPQADDSPKDDSSKDGEVTFRRRQPKSNNNMSLRKDTTVSVQSSSKQSSIKENITSSLKKLSKLESETVPKPKRKLKTPVVNLKAELSRISKKNPFQYEDEIFKVLSTWKEAGFKPLKREELNEIIQSLISLFDGKFFKNKVGANITSSDVRTYLLQDILRAIRSCRLKAFDSAYYPFKKEFYSKSDFKTWLYNPFLNFKGENKIKSFFLEDLKNPASKIKPKFRVVESQYPKHVEILKRQFLSKFFSNNGDCACALAAWSPEDDNNLVLATEKLMEFYENNHKKFSDGKRKRYYKAKIDENEYVEKPSMKISGFLDMLVEFFEFPGNYYPENDDGQVDYSDANVKKHYWKYQKKYERARDFFKVRGTDGLTDDVWFDYALPIFMKEEGY